MRTPFLPLLAALAACHHHGSSSAAIPVFVEVERNDDPLRANHFGVIRPGDRLIIEGNVRADLVDPFDGFAFTAGVPLHVDFELFVHNAADLDVCLYDPQIDETVACFATANNPEQGGVDVFADGLDFHLVVESFAGDATYSLEISVQPLFGRLPMLEAGASGLAGTAARADHSSAAPQGYQKPEPARRLVFERVLEIDLASGWIVERRRQLFPEAR